MDKELCKERKQNFSKSLALSILFYLLLHKGLCASSFPYVIQSREYDPHFKLLYNAFGNSLFIDILGDITEIFLLIFSTLFKPLIPSPPTEEMEFKYFLTTNPTSTAPFVQHALSIPPCYVR